MHDNCRFTIVGDHVPYVIGWEGEHSPFLVLLKLMSHSFSLQIFLLEPFVLMPRFVGSSEVAMHLKLPL